MNMAKDPKVSDLHVTPDALFDELIDKDLSVEVIGLQTTSLKTGDTNITKSFLIPN